MLIVDQDVMEIIGDYMPAGLYDWDTWFTHKEFTIHRGKDYVCGQGSMAQQIRNAAAMRGLRVRLQEGEDCYTVFVQQPIIDYGDNKRGVD